MATPNAYLEGNFGPVREEVTVTELPVTGIVPDHLEGRYVRTGPNPITDPDPATYHWFLGTGMVHGVRLRGGRAEWYRNRYVRSAEVAQILVRCADAQHAAVGLHHVDSRPAVWGVHHQAHRALSIEHLAKRLQAEIGIGQVMKDTGTDDQVERSPQGLDTLDR